MIKVLGRSEYNPNSPMPLSGVEYHRQYMPFEYMRASKPFEFRFDGKNLHKQDDTPIDLSEFDIYHVVRKDVKVDKEGNWTDAHNITKVKEYGLPVVIDFDDLWRLDSTHALYDYYKRNKVEQLSIGWMQRADHVTTTTERLASYIRKYNSNVTVIPNAIHPLLEQFAWSDPDRPYLNFWDDPSKNHTVSKPRIGWVGSIHHKVDINMLRTFFKNYWKSQLSKDSHLIQGGYVNGQAEYQRIAEIMQGGSVEGRRGLKIIRCLPVEKYATMYKWIDIALAPVASSEFNECKSELKILEAGHFGIPVIASNVYPYNTVIKHGVNGFLVDNTVDCHKEWYKYIKELVYDSVLRFNMGQALRQTVLDRFNIKQSNEIRYNLYRELCKK